MLRDGGQRIGLPRVAASCDFLQPARFEEILDVVVTIKNLGRKSVTYGFEFFKENIVIARGQITAVCCRVSADRIESVEIPPDIRKKLE